jgi:phosphoribosylamine--glycine ligase
MKTNILIIGSGGREHALAWKIAQSERVNRLFVAPGNAGTTWPADEVLAPAENIPIAPEDFDTLITFAHNNHIGLTVVGPEGPLAAGIVDAFGVAGLPIFGPTQSAARLESSKAFAKAFMAEHNIPTAAYETFTDYEFALDYLEGRRGPLVIKASGLAAGKGVIMCRNTAEAEAALQSIMLDRHFGAAGDEIVIEEWLNGPELSVLAFTDGKTIVPLSPARDHKRVFDRDEGPNTGGMGAYAPVSDIDPALMMAVMQTVLQPAVNGMAARGTPYKGVLYAGLMLTEDGPKVLEFNCRFGDPETQVIIPLLDSDLVEIMLACIEGRLENSAVRLHPGACATVVMAAPGYPGSYPKGSPITGLAQAASLDNVSIFHAGTKLEDGRVVTNGGRVLSVSATGPTLPAALHQAYQGADLIHFKGAHYRKDIGGKIVD